MFNFDICVVHLGFGAILGDPDLGQSMLVTTPYYSCLLHLTNSGDQL